MCRRMGESSPGARELSKTIFLSVPLLLLVILYWGQALVLEWEGIFGYGEVEDYGLPGDVMEQFRLFDSNADGSIDPHEFSILIHHLNVVSSCSVLVN